MKKPLILMLYVCLLFAAASTPLTPGRYKEWGASGIDDLEIMKTFRIADYDHIVVMPFDTTATPLPDKSDKSYDTIKSALASYTFTLVEAMKPELKAKADVEQSDKAPKSGKTLIVRGTVDELSPGSRAKRYLAGALAGAAGTKITGELVDAKTNTTLLRFTQNERSHGSFKFGGGKDLDVMRDSIHAAGKKVAKIIDSF